MSDSIMSSSVRFVTRLDHMLLAFPYSTPCADLRREDTMNQRRRATISNYVGTGVLILLCSLAAVGCSQPDKTVETISFGPLQEDQQIVAGYYRDEAMVLKEKAALSAESAVRYEHLFGPQSDWVSGARQLSQYYAVAAQDLERRAQAYEEAARTGKQQRR